MKRTILSLLLIPAALFQLKAQNNDPRPYWELMEDPDVNFYQIQSSFNQYWDGRSVERGKGWKAFKRWEDFVAPRVFPSGDRSLLRTTWNEYQSMSSSNAFRNAAGNWTYIGNTDVPQGGGAGRINCVAFHPSDPNIIFAGAPAGGLWRTTNGGASWICTTDQLPTLGISAIAFDPQNPDIVYMGTGDMDGGNTAGVGILKSFDGGMTWNSTGLSFNITQDISVARILVHPTATNIIIAATSQGIYKSYNGGNSWTLTATIQHRDLRFKPDDPSVVYATRNGRFYRSTDTASSFTQITSGLGSASSMARLAIGVSPANPNYVYLLVSNTGQGFYGLYRSTDAGLTFSLRSDSPNILGWEANGSDQGGQANYDLAIAVDPNNAETIHCGGVNIWRSTNGGNSWTIVGHWYGAGSTPYVHADIHSLDYSPLNGQLYSGNDGGVFRKSFTGNVWTDISNNMQIAQLYRMGGSATNPDLILSGWQDNGTNLKEPGGWSEVLGGDGMEAIISYANPSTMFGEYYYGDIHRSTDGGNNWNNIVNSNGSGVDEQGEWVTPYVQHPTVPTTLLVGKSQIWRSMNNGTSWSQVGSIGSGFSKVNALTYAPSDPNYIYAARTNKFYVSSNGTSFTDRTAGLPGNAAIQYIAVSNTDPEKVWVCLSGFSNNSKVFYSANAGLNWTNVSAGLPNIPTNCIVYENNSDDALYLGTDLGVFYRDNSTGVWVPFSGGLPNTIVRELEIHYATGKIRAATYGRGIWESDLYAYIANDIRIAHVAYPNNEVCGAAFAPEITLRNNSDHSLNSAVISYQSDNGPVSTFSWTGILAPQSETNLTLSALPVVAGNHVFKIWTSLPNNNNDSDPGNDTIAINYIGSPGKIHTVLDLQLDCFGSETGWQIKSGASVLYEAPVNSYPGTTAVWVDGGTFVSEHFCLAPACYDLVLNDSEGNGLHGMEDGCDINGSYLLYNEAGDVLAQNTQADADFGTSVTHNFCLTSDFFTAFSATNAEICSGNSIQFSDLSSPGATNWIWTFPGGNPATSSDQHPLVNYASAGTYDVTLVSGDGTNSDTKTITAVVTVNSTPQINLSFADLSCFGDCNGSIQSQVLGGTQPFSIIWSNNATSDSLTQLCAGNYTMELMDAKGCISTAMASINEPPAITLNMTSSQSSCGINDGTAAISASGGTGSYNYLWNNGEISASLSNLAIGTYTVTVTDANGCEKTATAIIENPNAPTVSATAISETCSGDCDGSINALASGGTGNLTLSWNNGLGSNASYSDLCSGMYIVTVSDDNLCADMDTVNVNEGYAYPVANFIVNDSVADINQTVNFINMSTSQVSSFFWDFGDGGTSTFSSTSHMFSDTGVYTITNILNNNGCRDTLTFDLVVINSSSIDHQLYDESFNVYPNPASEQLELDFGRLNVNGRLEVLSANGQLVKTYELKNSSHFSIAISEFAGGMYILRVHTSDYTLTRQLMIRK